MKTTIIKAGYDAMAEMYNQHRGNLKSGKYLQQLLKYLPKNSSILDLGCGGGVGVDDILLKAGHSVIGLDISREQIKLARKQCPAGEYLVRDILDLKTGEYSVQAIVSLYAVFHLPRERQAAWLKTIASYLPKGGMLLVTMGDREFEGEHILHGQRMWSSQYGTVKNTQMVEGAGLGIILNEIDVSGGERHQVILAEKR